MIIELNDSELTRLLAALHCEWSSLVDELAAGPSDDSHEDELLQAIRMTQDLMGRLVELKPEYFYLLPPENERRVYEQ